jgi:hypothetical protein
VVGVTLVIAVLTTTGTFLQAFLSLVCNKSIYFLSY